MDSIWQNYKLPIIAIIVLAILAAMSIVFVGEDEQAVVLQGGEPVKTINKFNPDEPFGATNAGIQWHLPLVQRVQIVDRRILDLDMERQQVLTSDQQRLQVDAYARFRIIDPIEMVRNARTEGNVANQLAPILTSVLRQELGRRTFASLLTAERGNAMTNIRDILDRQARQYGAQVLDVRIKRADLPDGTPLEAAFTRMQSDRQEEAETIRAQGRRDAQIIRAEAEGQAARIYATAYGKDPDFYDFYRAMQSYRTTFQNSESESSFILSPDNEYLNQFRGRR
ncbi:protease modulator HflC [Erythrobacter litoralis]|uniref:Protein HflC n=1 Tax=Erythrobacter litoralis (strain HTCC2594) TaxID=314225 RepID=Q2N7I2_ERYLH|nr:protease modulator HflC [Erythrobacter litoralis]ABC64359.1 HflC [Erythrobacter litoralis HTCC2594]